MTSGLIPEKITPYGIFIIFIFLFLLHLWSVIDNINSNISRITYNNAPINVIQKDNSFYIFTGNGNISLCSENKEPIDNGYLPNKNPVVNKSVLTYECKSIGRFPVQGTASTGVLVDN